MYTMVIFTKEPIHIIDKLIYRISDEQIKDEVLRGGSDD